MSMSMSQLHVLIFYGLDRKPAWHYYKIAFQMDPLLDWHTIDTSRMHIRNGTSCRTGCGVVLLVADG